MGFSPRSPALGMGPPLPRSLQEASCSLLRVPGAENRPGASWGLPELFVREPLPQTGASASQEPPGRAQNLWPSAGSRKPSWRLLAPPGAFSQAAPQEPPFGILKLLCVRRALSDSSAKSSPRIRHFLPSPGNFCLATRSGRPPRDVRILFWKPLNRPFGP